MDDRTLADTLLVLRSLIRRVETDTDRDGLLVAITVLSTLKRA